MIYSVVLLQHCAVQFNVLIHIAQLIRRWDVSKSLILRNKPYILTSWTSYDVSKEIIFDASDHNILRLQITIHWLIKQESFIQQDKINIRNTVNCHLHYQNPDDINEMWNVKFTDRYTTTNILTGVLSFLRGFVNKLQNETKLQFMQIQKSQHIKCAWQETVLIKVNTWTHRRWHVVSLHTIWLSWGSTQNAANDVRPWPCTTPDLDINEIIYLELHQISGEHNASSYW